ncbi:MAG TPA: hypothetical protein PKY59_10250 [Pyrinomonadaceae bacterium]|nr:hypothetical protein [Pyrinomonadaceae bacterium]
MGKRQIETYEEQFSLETRRPDLTVNIAATVKTGFNCKKGDVLGEITSSGLFRRRTRAAAAGSGFSTAAANGTVDDASVFTPGDVLKNAAGTTIGTIAANGVNTLTNQITLTGNAAVNVAAGNSVFGSDGSQVAAFLAEEGSDGVGDTSINVITQSPALDISKTRGLDDTAITDLGGKKLPGNLLKF